MKKKVVILVIVITLIIGLYFVIDYFKNYTKRIVIDNREQWDIISSSNTAMSGDLMGRIYEKDYDLTKLEDDVLSSIFIDHFLATTSDIFTEKNKKSDFTYEISLTEEEFQKIAHKYFGPDYKVTIEEIKYGCGRYLKKENNKYLIGSNDPDSCGLFNGQNTSSYVSYISDYRKEKDEILITLKVAYIDINQTANEEGEETEYKAYQTKDKKVLINNNYNPECLYEEKEDSSCYKDFNTYQVTLKKESNRKYYFYSIEKK